MPGARSDEGTNGGRTALKHLKSAAQRLLDRLCADGTITSTTRPQDVYNKYPDFQAYTMDKFRRHFNETKLKQGTFLRSSEEGKEGDNEGGDTSAPEDKSEDNDESNGDDSDSKSSRKRYKLALPSESETRTGVDIDNPPVIAAVYRDAATKTDRVVICAGMFGIPDAKDVHVDLDEDDAQTAIISYGWPAALFSPQVMCATWASTDEPQTYYGRLNALDEELAHHRPSWTSHHDSPGQAQDDGRRRSRRLHHTEERHRTQDGIHILQDMRLMDMGPRLLGQPPASGVVAAGQEKASPAATPEGPKTVGDWSSFTTPEGKVYYFNNKTQETTWTCPPEFTSSGVTTEPKDEWQTFYTNEGKPYYYNARTNSQLTRTIRRSCRESHRPSRQKRAMDPVVAVPYKAAYASQYANREEAEAAFREMLTSSGVPSTATWEQALPKIVNDKRYTALPKLADRKEVFKSWCVEHAEREKENALRAEQQKRDDFLALLAEHSNIIRSRMRFVELEPKIRLDPRYTACDTRTREDLFYDHIDKLADAERKAKIEARQAAEAAFRDFLQSGEIITLNTQWRELLETLASEPTYKALDPADALKVFEGVMSDLKREEAAKALAEKEALREAEKKRRVDYRNLLQEQVQAGKLHLRTRWRSFAETIRDDARFIALSQDEKFSPQTLFDDFCDDLEDRVHNSRKKLKEALANAGVAAVSETDTVDGLCERLGGADAIQGVPEMHVRVLLAEFIDHAQSRAQHAAKRIEKYSALFSKLLTKKVRRPMSMDSAQPMLDSHSCYKKLPEAVRTEMFAKHVEALSAPGHEIAAEDSDTSGEIEEDEEAFSVPASPSTLVPQAMALTKFAQTRASDPY
ncbi:unnamed protein product (mitochondrion) [Plasmodiophora brassicae]|uniref:WW domain-containing protein n=1 Tax=Plasmodiophora brassicae TaxID=37360 RepID=A0A3P3YHH5_PLABS|nr:unnamed protein product [Plasmodiophora brassicae]